MHKCVISPSQTKGSLKTEISLQILKQEEYPGLFWCARYNYMALRNRRGRQKSHHRCNQGRGGSRDAKCDRDFIYHYWFWLQRKERRNLAVSRIWKYFSGDRQQRNNPISAGNWLLPTTWMSKKTDFPLEPLERNEACWRLDVSLVNPVSDLSYNTERQFVLCCIAIFTFICYGNNIKLMHFSFLHKHNML